MKTLLLSIILTTISLNSFANEICKYGTIGDENIATLYNDEVTDVQTKLFNKHIKGYKNTPKLELQAITVNGIDYKYVITSDDTTNGIILEYTTEKVIATIHDQDINCI